MGPAQVILLRILGIPSLCLAPLQVALFMNTSIWTRYVESEINGDDGPIKVSFPTEVENPIPKAWVETMRSLGNQASGDPFSGNFTGGFTNAASKYRSADTPAERRHYGTRYCRVKTNTAPKELDCDH